MLSVIAAPLCVCSCELSIEGTPGVRGGPPVPLPSLLLHVPGRVGNAAGRKMDTSVPIIASPRKYFPQSKYCTRGRITGMLLTKRESGLACCGFRRLLARWDKKPESYLAFLSFACGLRVWLSLATRMAIPARTRWLSISLGMPQRIRCR